MAFISNNFKLYYQDHYLSISVMLNQNMLPSVENMREQSHNNVKNNYMIHFTYVKSL